MKILIPALIGTIAIAGCSTGGTNAPEEQAGYYVDIHQSQARGGVGNYVDRNALDRSRYLDKGEYHAKRGKQPGQQRASAPRVEEPITDEVRTSQAAPVSPPAPEEPKAMDDPQQLINEIRDDLHFEFGRAELKPGAVQELQKLGDAMSQSSDSRLIIVGNADAVGSDEYNRELSRQRAEAVREVLVSRGVRPDQIMVRALGESKPVAPNDTESGRAQNRRVDLNLG